MFEHGPEGESIKMARASDDEGNELCAELSLMEETEPGAGR